MRTNATTTELQTQTAALLAHAKRHTRLDPHDELTRKAQELVAQSFFGTLLKQASQSPFHNDMFEGGKGGAAYQEMFNQKMAEHMASGVGSKLVRPLIHKFQANKAYQKHKSAKAAHRTHGFGATAGGGAAGHDSHQASAFLASMLGA